MAQQFKVVHDGTGDVQEASVEDFADYQAKGYRLLDPVAYAAAYDEANPPAEPPPLSPAAQAMAEQGNKDAALASKEQYPNAQSEGDDAKAADDAVAEKQADDAETQESDLVDIEEGYLAGLVDENGNLLTINANDHPELFKGEK
jgi:uncharacterized protein (UPF0335 family)